MFRRVVDIVASALGLIVLALPMVIIAMLIRRESKGPAIFRQRRAGKDGKPFTLLKYRTMRPDADPYGHSPHSGDDPRLTKVGRWLREKSLDELPQLMNILTGTMTLVGPRPLYERQAQTWTPEQRRRLEVKPGLTGYAQVYGRGSLTVEEKIEMDVYYVVHRSLWLDVKILLRTVMNVFKRHGEVYEKQYSRDGEYETGVDREA